MYINNPGHMSKMAAMTIFDKNLKRLSSPGPDSLESSNLACSTGGPHCVYKSSPWDELDLFYGKVNLTSQCI